MKEWQTIEEMFEELENNKIKYVILRNYEEIDESNFYTAGHADIDFLTENSHSFSRVIQAYPRFIEDDGIHYLVKIKGVEVIIDVRSVGDDYYDKKWQKEILKNRTKLNNRFFVVDELNYYMSLIYHAILQKNELSVEYLDRLNKMSSSQNFNAKNEKDHLLILEEFMKKNKYKYTIPYDIHVPLRTNLINASLIKRGMKVYLRDIKISILKFGSKIKRSIIKK